jgi:hypothetical protein
MDVTALAGVVSALAAAGALWFAWQTVIETRELRREDRLARLPELVADLGDAALRIQHGSSGEAYAAYPIARLRLKAAILASGESFPCCEAVVRTDLSRGLRTNESLTEVIDVALEEIAASMHASL